MRKPIFLGGKKEKNKRKREMDNKRAA